jgi:RNA polymerase primary sigma factor
MKEIKITQSITPRESENISRYFANISSTHPLDPDQEADLALRIHKGDLQARNELVNANLRFVVSVAKQYQNLGVPLDDLINEGNIGLIRAAERFDPTKGFKFATFAVWWIRQAILSFLVDKSRMVRLPQNIAHIISRIRSAANAFEQENQRPPSMEELADRTGISAEKLEEYLGHTNNILSMDAPLSSDSDATVGEMLEDTSSEAADRVLIAESLRHDLQVAMNSISRREQEIIRLYYGMDGESRSMDEIAMDYHLSRERVRQLIERSVATIRQLHGEALQKYA